MMPTTEAGKALLVRMSAWQRDAFGIAPAICATEQEAANRTKNELLAPERLAKAFEAIGSSDLDKLVWSSFSYPLEYDDEGEVVDDPYRFASLARALVAALETIEEGDR